jgi:hypothetical protein
MSIAKQTDIMLRLHQQLSKEAGSSVNTYRALHHGNAAAAAEQHLFELKMHKAGYRR